MRDLEFGVFITPSSAQPEAVVELAVLADQVGLDLATFQDHPYQPRLLDAWTLISYVAARTRRIKLAPNVMNVPLRPPAVMARAAAGLDQLSGGRVELGIGAGGVLGRDRGDGRPPADARARASTRSRRRSTSCASCGPMAAASPTRAATTSCSARRAGRSRRTTSALWIGAYKPRMLALTGRKGDGWLPSLPYLQPGDLAKGNAAIDAAAREAGRDPGEIRRMLNLPPASVDEVLRLAREERVTRSSSWPTTRSRSGPRRSPGGREAWRSAARGARRRGAAAGRRRGRRRRGGRRSPPRARARRDDASRRRRSALGITPTPDDGVRRSARMPWDESKRPHRAPEPDATYTDRGRAAGKHLIDVHDMLRTRARRAARPDRAGQGRRAQRRRRALDAQRDGAAPERLDAGRVLLALLPRRGHAPLARGRLDLPAPAPRPRHGAGHRSPDRGAPRHPRRDRGRRPRAGRAPPAPRGLRAAAGRRSTC